MFQTGETSLQSAYAIHSFITCVYGESFPVHVGCKRWQTSQQQLFRVAREIF